MKDIIHNAQLLTDNNPDSKELSTKQLENWAYRTFRQKNPDRLKSNSVTAQKTTSKKRSQCNIAQECRWFRNLNAALDFMRMNNTGLCKKSGKTFGELIAYFVIGGDEACLMADQNDDVRIISRLFSRWY